MSAQALPCLSKIGKSARAEMAWSEVSAKHLPRVTWQVDLDAHLLTYPPALTYLPPVLHAPLPSHVPVSYVPVSETKGSYS